MTTREIQRHLRELYGVDVSDGLISEVTASIQDDVRAWQSRPLEELYVVVYLDAMQVAIRDQQVVRKKAVYVAIGVTLEGERDCLGLWIEQHEGARFWTRVLTEPGNASSPSSPSPQRSAASSTPPTPSRACTCRSARRSKPADTSPTTTPRCG